MAAAMRRVHQGVQQVCAFLLRASLVGMVVRVRRLRMVRTATTEFMQIAYRGEYGVHQHRKHKQCQRGKAQQPGNAVAKHADHRVRMLRDAWPVKQLQPRH